MPFKMVIHVKERICCLREQILVFKCGLSGVVKVSCILRHWGVQLIMAYSWARPAILVAVKG